MLLLKIISRQINDLCRFLKCISLLCYCSFFSVFAQDPSSESQELDVSLYPDVTYCIDPDWLPYEAIRNNRHVGMSFDYMRYIGIQAEVNFVLVKTNTWEQSLAFLKEGKCQVASMLNRSPEREKYLLFTQPYFVGTNVVVSREEGEFIHHYENIGSKRLGAVSSYRQAEYVANYYPDIDLHLVENENEGLTLLSEGEIDLFIGSLLSINAKIQKNGFSNLHISGVAEPQDQLAMGVSMHNPELLTLLEGAVQSIPEWLHVEVYKEWNNVKVVDEADYRYVWLALMIMTVISGLVFWRQSLVGRFNQQLKKQNQQLELLQEELVEKNKSLEFMSMRDPLTAMFNRNFMTGRCEQERQLSIRKGLPTCLIMLDIDFFKPINDNFGHSAGDKVLKEMAIRIANTVREMDTSARWGGEEFIVLCPQTSSEAALLLAERLRKAISAHEFTQVGHLTCSFGVAELQGDESFIQWFDRADQALYQAKSDGRDKVVSAN